MNSRHPSTTVSSGIKVANRMYFQPVEDEHSLENSFTIQKIQNNIPSVKSMCVCVCVCVEEKCEEEEECGEEEKTLKTVKEVPDRHIRTPDEAVGYVG